MENNSLGSTVRKGLLKYAIMERISIWDFNEWTAVWMSFLSSYRVSITIILAVCITLGSFGFIIIRKKVFTQKDTLCAFVFMVVSIFLLESVQKMLKIEVSLDRTYSNVEITIPFSPLIPNTPTSRELICKDTFNDRLEKTKDQLEMGDRAADAYRNLVRETMLRKRPQKEPGLVQTTIPGRIIGVEGPPQIRKEYCIYRRREKESVLGRKCPKCTYLNEKEFNEAKADLEYIDKVNKEYQEIEKNIEVSRNMYRKQSVELMKNFKDFNKLSYFVREEMGTVGISFSRIESAILHLVNKYEMIFAGGPRKHTRLRTEGDAVCVTIEGEDKIEPPREIYQVKQKVVKKKTKITEETGLSNIGRQLMILRTGLVGDSGDSYTRREKKEPGTVEEAVHDMIKSNAEAPVLQRQMGDSYRTGKTKKDPFFRAMTYTLTVTEIVIFIQVLLVLGMIISIIFDRKWLYFVFYASMCGSLIASLVLGYIAFVNSAALSSLCQEGLKCDMQMGQSEERVQAIGNMIDMPERALKRSVEMSAEHLQKQINIVLTSNTAEYIQDIEGQVDRLFQVKKDFDLLISTNPHRRMVRKNEIYGAGEKIRKTLNEMKMLDKEIRGNRWTETFKKISQVGILLMPSTNRSNRKKREVLSSLSKNPTPVDGSSCSGKEQLVCELRDRFDSLFVGLFLFSVVLSVAIAI